MAQSLPARAPKPWTRYDTETVTIMVNEGDGSLVDLPAPPDGRFAVWPDGRSVIIGPTGARLVLVAAVDSGDGRGMKAIFSEPSPACRREGCDLHVVMRGATDDHVCLPATPGAELETEARCFMDFALRAPLAEGLVKSVTYTTPDDLMEIILHSGAIGTKVTLDPSPSMTKGWGA